MNQAIYIEQRGSLAHRFYGIATKRPVHAWWRSLDSPTASWSKMLLFASAMLSFSASMVSAQRGPSQDYEILYAELSACLDSSNAACIAAFENAIVYVENLTDDSLAAEHFLELGTLRMKEGRWDEQSKHLFDLALRYSKRSGDACVYMKSQFALSQHARFLNVTDSLLMHAERSLEAALHCGDSSRQARAEVYIGSAYLNQSNYPEALAHFQLAEVLYETLNDQSGLGGLYLDMALLYSEMHQKSVARNYTFRAAEIFKATGEEMKYGVALVDLSSDLLDVKMADSALHCLRLAEPIVTATNLRAAGYLEQNFGAAFYIKGQYQEAIEHYRKGLALSEKIGNTNLSTLLHIWISESYLAMRRYADAYHYALLADSLAARTAKGFLRTKAMHALAKAAHKYEKYDRSYTAFEAYILLTDSLFGDEKQREIAALEQVYEADKNRKAIAFQKQENALLAEAHAASTNRNYALLACLMLTIVLAYAFISKQRHKLRAQLASMKIKALENENLNQEVDFKSRELTSQALHLARKNEMIQSLHDQLKAISNEHNNKALNAVVSQLKFTQHQEDHWDKFTEQFKALNPEFQKKFNQAHPQLTKGDLRLAALLRMGLGTKDIASMLNISEPGMKKARYRLRKKMNLDATDSLEAEVLKY